MKDFSWEFKVYTDVLNEEEVPVYRDATEEEREEARKAGGLIPKKIKIGSDLVTKVVKKNAIYRRRVPDIRALAIHQTFNREGNVFKKKFIVEETNTNNRYVVKGNYFKFKKVLDNIYKSNRIGYDPTTD